MKGRCPLDSGLYVFEALESGCLNELELNMITLLLRQLDCCSLSLLGCDGERFNPKTVSRNVLTGLALD